MSAAWATIAGLTVGTIAIKAAGPVALGGRPLPRTLAAIVGLLAPALLAGLVVVETLGATGGGLSLDARVAGLAAAGCALALRAPVLVVILVAAVVTAAVRALA
jgi:Branched-chain amino acid transport protein (AzlD)